MPTSRLIVSLGATQGQDGAGSIFSCGPLGSVPEVRNIDLGSVIKRTETDAITPGFGNADDLVAPGFHKQDPFYPSDLGDYGFRGPGG